MQYWYSYAHAASVHRKSLCAPPASYRAPPATSPPWSIRAVRPSSGEVHLHTLDTAAAVLSATYSTTRRASTHRHFSQLPAVPRFPVRYGFAQCRSTPGRSSHRPRLLCRARASRHDPIAKHHPHARHAHLALIIPGAAHAHPSSCPIRDTTPWCSITCMPSMRTGRSPSPAPRSPTPVACIVTAFTSTRLTAAPIATSVPFRTLPLVSPSVPAPLSSPPTVLGAKTRLRVGSARRSLTIGTRDVQNACALDVSRSGVRTASPPLPCRSPYSPSRDSVHQRFRPG
ncbi:hypothetical protein B0H14DRAFT_290211 [Mycena olivaceomarginata]|nr:hypothetical protein B0H14DRAFT_290211 [Mycena olivaceomarginata]